MRGWFKWKDSGEESFTYKKYAAQPFFAFTGKNDLNQTE